jgi:hypothetical protein
MGCYKRALADAVAKAARTELAQYKKAKKPDRSGTRMARNRDDCSKNEPVSGFEPLTVRLQGGFASPRGSIAGYLSGTYALLGARNVRARRHASTPVSVPFRKLAGTGSACWPGLGYATVRASAGKGVI